MEHDRRREAEALRAEVEAARVRLAEAERRARTFLARRGVVDQTQGELQRLLREQSGQEE